MNLPRVKLKFLYDKEDKATCVTTAYFTSSLAHQSITIPEGFLHDGSTQKSILWGLVQFGLGSYGEHSEAAAVHDWIYVRKGSLPDGRKITRKECDKLFRVMCIDYGIRKDRARKAYWAIRLFGWAAWREGNGKPTILKEY